MRYIVGCKKCEGMCYGRMLWLPGVGSVHASGGLFARFCKDGLC